MYVNKTRESLKVIRETVIKALHSSTLHPYKTLSSTFTTNVTRAKAKGNSLLTVYSPYCMFRNSGEFNGINIGLH